MEKGGGIDKFFWQFISLKFFVLQTEVHCEIFGQRIALAFIHISVTLNFLFICLIELYLLEHVPYIHICIYTVCNCIDGRDFLGLIWIWPTKWRSYSGISGTTSLCSFTGIKRSELIWFKTFQENRVSSTFSDRVLKCKCVWNRTQVLNSAEVVQKYPNSTQILKQYSNSFSTILTFGQCPSIETVPKFWTVLGGGPTLQVQIQQ